MRLSQVIEGYTLDARARRLSPATISNYGFAFDKLTAQVGDGVDFAAITANDVRALMASQSHLSAKSLLNLHACLSALWVWAVREGLAPVNVVRAIPQPKPELHPVEPFTRAEVAAMLKAVERGPVYSRPGKADCSNVLPLAARNRAIILLLLDTGVRASECATLKTADVSLTIGRVTVMGKGAKERTIPFSARTGQALWRYHTERPESNEPYFFLTAAGGPLDRGDLMHLVQRIGQRAGVEGAHPHRFRHTFAITFLRNGGNVYVLQQLLGHTSLDMCRRYLHIVEADTEAAHKQASPVANWRL